eukprot:TRINITY_DN62190_c0_g1_i1.p1 TRINITY_DN62190_c0_g1~~TRINITY_DN62190_c0_g1_i1.p1  ORF type:complete len:222 (+),score=43.03 TRINITY_DN62190_c0_g1_i1:71-667(+)
MHFDSGFPQVNRLPVASASKKLRSKGSKTKVRLNFFGGKSKQRLQKSSRVPVAKPVRGSKNRLAKVKGGLSMPRQQGPPVAACSQDRPSTNAEQSDDDWGDWTAQGLGSVADTDGEQASGFVEASIVSSGTKAVGGVIVKSDGRPRQSHAFSVASGGAPNRDRANGVSDGNSLTDIAAEAEKRRMRAIRFSKHLPQKH